MSMGAIAQSYPCDHVEHLRKASAESLDPQRRATLGQYFTPAPAARLIASLLAPNNAQKVRLLDPGAGIGSLTAAAVERLVECDVPELDIVAWEVD